MCRVAPRGFSIRTPRPLAKADLLKIDSLSMSMFISAISLGERYLSMHDACRYIVTDCRPSFLFQKQCALIEA